MRRSRSALRRIPLAEAWPPQPGVLTVTMARGQWDQLLAQSYAAGAVLLELDADENPLAAYQRAPEGVH